MIRRDPTMIPMTDSDIQEVRERLRARKLLYVTADSQYPGGITYAAAKEAKEAKKKAKNERLGL